MTRIRSKSATAALVPVASCLAACTGGVVSSSSFVAGGSPPAVAYTVGGTVAGLTGTGLVLQDSGADNLLISANGAFSFPTSLAAGSTYNVSVLAQPLTEGGSAQTCTVGGGTGTVAGAVTSVTVSCVAKTSADDSIGGSVTGLAGTGLVLQGADGSQLAVSANGPFTIATGVAPGTAYTVSVLSPPISPDQVCAVANGAGTTGAADISSIVVSCQTTTAKTYTVGGTVTGISGTSASLTLLDNGRDALVLTSDGAFTFGLQIPDGTPYSVTEQASGAISITCALSNTSGTIAATNVTNVTVACQGGSPSVTTGPATFTLGGTVTGLSGGGASVVLKDNGGDALTVSADGSFAFPTALTIGSTYSVTEQVSSPAVACTLGNASGTMGAANISSVSVTCQPRYSLGGDATGISGTGGSVVLKDSAGDTLTLTADGPFTFPTLLSSGASYSVTAQASSSALICTLGNASGSVTTANISNVTLTCQPTYTVGGTVTGLAATGATLTLLDNGGDALTLTRDGPFTFPTPLTSGSAYLVTEEVSGGTFATSCALTGASGTVGTAPISVGVSCQSDATLSVAVSGLSSTLAAQVAAGQATPLVLADGLGDSLSISQDGTYAFQSTPVLGTAYTVMVSGQPAATGGATQTELVCVVSGGAGVAAGNTVVPVRCVDHPLGWLYVTNGGDGTLSPYLIAADGSPVPSGSAVQTGLAPRSLTGNALGTLYVVNAASGTLGVYSAASTTGVPALSGTVTAPATPTSVTLYGGDLLVTGGGSPGSAQLFTAGSSAAQTLPLGAAMAAANAPAASALAQPCADNMLYAYVANAQSNSVSLYSVTPNGLAATGLSYATGSGPAAIAGGSQAWGWYGFGTGFNAFNNVYVANAGDGTVSQYAVSCGTGALTSLASQPLSVGPGLASLALAYLPGQYPYYLYPYQYNWGQYLYTSSTAGVTGFPVGPGGVLGGPVGPAVPAGAAPGPLTSFVSYAQASTSSLTSATVTLTSAPASFIVPGMFVWDQAGALPAGTQVASVSADQLTVTLSAGPANTHGANGDGLVFLTPLVFVVDTAGDTVQALKINPVTGVLSATGTPAPTGRTPTAVYASYRTGQGH